MGANTEAPTAGLCTPVVTSEVAARAPVASAGEAGEATLAVEVAADTF